MRSASAQHLYLDFDGVLCDSLEECYRSSWLALEAVTVGPESPPEPPADPTYRGRFRRCRPFIRSGEDYLMVHRWVREGRVPSDQAAFDASLQQAGDAQRAQWKAALYAVRESLLEHHRALWLSWNPLYEGVADALQAQVTNSAAWILSTKKAEFIVEILAHHGVPWPLERTIYTGSRGKLDLIEERSGKSASVLIDDQADHLVATHASCQCYLALWGYVSAGAESFPHRMTLEQARVLITSFPRLPDA